MLTGNSKSDKTRLSLYSEMGPEILRCGYNQGDIFRAYQVSNGYIYDLDPFVAAKLAAKVISEMKKAGELDNLGVPELDPSNTEQYYIDLITAEQNKRKTSDLLALGKWIVSEYKAGRTSLEVALFSRNQRRTITITGYGSKGDVVQARYKAFSLRHWDIETLNRNILIPLGLRVATITPYEILPSKTGVRFKLEIQPISSVSYT